MTARLRTHRLVLIGLGSAIAAITACSAPEASNASEADAKETTQASSVAVDLIDASGATVGACSGTLIGPKMVLTAGHCIAGVSAWKVTGDTGSSSASVASTPWKNFGSDLAHPDHSDVGFILLDDPIKLDSYPQLATKAAKDGTKGLRFHRKNGKAKNHVSTSTMISGGEDKGFPLNYLVEIGSDEFLDTGGALLDTSGKIVGVVSGKGKTSNLLHIARVDGFSTFSKSAASCSSALEKRTWGSGNGGNGGGGYGGTPAPANTGGGGGGGGGWWGGGGGGGGAPAFGGYGGGGQGNGGGGQGNGGSGVGNIDGGATVPGSGGGGGAGVTGDPSAPTGAPAGGGGTATTPDATTCPGAPACVGPNCGGGSTGNNGGPGGPNAAPGSKEEGPDGPNCSGPNCGGCAPDKICADTALDYAGCLSCAASGPIVN